MYLFYNLCTWGGSSPGLCCFIIRFTSTNTSAKIEGVIDTKLEVEFETSWKKLDLGKFLSKFYSRIDFKSGLEH